ncbi:MAG TPA: GNAT family N-acetyltransferase [Steroidobacteraceae bacterium]
MIFRTGDPADHAVLREIDDDAGLLFEQAGIVLNLPDDHEFVRTEHERWHGCLVAGGVLIAMDPRGLAVGFAAVSRLDTEPFLAQLSVRHGHMRRGIGSALLRAALDAVRADHAAMWLTTYSHLQWNRPFYERNGFVRIAERDCGDGVRAELALERRSLPQAEHRIAMRRSLRDPAAGP